MEHEECLKVSYCKHTNNCKDFEFANVEPENQDAFGETNGYKPRQPRQPIQKDCDGQMCLFVDENSEGRLIADD